MSLRACFPSQHFLNFLPLPHGQRSLRPTLVVTTVVIIAMRSQARTGLAHCSKAEAPFPYVFSNLSGSAFRPQSFCTCSALPYHKKDARVARRARIFARLREGLAYDEIGREEGLTA